MKNQKRITSIGNLHLGSNELDEILKQGFRDKRRRATVLTHLAGPCPACRGILRRRAVGVSLDSPVVRPDEQDAVVWALRREVLKIRLGESVLAELRPAHSHWARKTGQAPLAFARLVLEESFEAELLEPAAAVTIAEGSLHSLETASTLAKVQNALYQDVRALARLHLAGAQQEMGEFEAAADLFRQSWKILTAGGSAAAVACRLRASSAELGADLGEPEPAVEGLEVLAMAQELRAGLDLAQGLPWQALDRLKTAGWLLKGVRIPGRRSEHLLRRGRVLSQLKRFSEAREVFADALTGLPVPSSPRLQLEIIHHQAALELQDGDCTRTYGLLIEFKDLYLDHGAPVMKVQRCWLLARVAYLMDCDRLALPRFRQALEGFQRLGCDVEALHVLMDLIRCAVRMGRPPDEFLTLRKELHSLLESPSCRLVSVEMWRKFLHEALDEGWSLPWMEGLLDASLGSSIH
jgi:tetratricopeptide (TPR) repeat protein